MKRHQIIGIECWLQNYNTERALRKKYYNQIEDLKGKIRVYCRVRPMSTSEKERGL